MRRFEYVWSLLVAFFILCGALAWTAASPPAPPLIATDLPMDSWQVSGPHSPCRKYAQYEFKVGYLVSPSCLPQAN